MSAVGCRVPTVGRLQNVAFFIVNMKSLEIFIFKKLNGCTLQWRITQLINCMTFSAYKYFYRHRRRRRRDGESIFHAHTHDDVSRLMRMKKKREFRKNCEAIRCASCCHSNDSIDFPAPSGRLAGVPFRHDPSIVHQTKLDEALTNEQYYYYFPFFFSLFRVALAWSKTHPTQNLKAWTFARQPFFAFDSSAKSNTKQ